MTLRALVCRHPLLWFTGLTMALSWWPWLLFTRGLSSEPIASFGPFLGALVVLIISEGKRGVIGLFRRMTRWRVGVGWYLVALGLPVLLSGVALVSNTALGGEVDLGMGRVDWLGVGPEFLLLLLIPGVGGAWEEPGWRGYALPRLQTGRSAIQAALILGVLMALWHLPLIVAGRIAWTDGIQILGAVIVLNWLFNNARGSVLIIMIAHAANNTVWSALTSKIISDSDSDYARQAMLQAFVWCAAAVIVLLVSGPGQLSRRHSKQEESALDGRESQEPSPYDDGRLESAQSNTLNRRP